MRKITQQIANALFARQNVTKGNTATMDGEVFLHGNKIAKIENGALLMSLAGWNTPTTRERLNGIADVFGAKDKFSQKDFEPYLGNRLIRDDDWYHVTDV